MPGGSDLAWGVNNVAYGDAVSRYPEGFGWGALIFAPTHPEVGGIGRTAMIDMPAHDFQGAVFVYTSPLSPSSEPGAPA